MTTLQKATWLLFSSVVVMLISMLSCGDDDNPVTEVNKPPAKPTIDVTSGTPPHGSSGQSLTPTLRWKCSDPDGDVLKHDVHFGKSSTPPVVSSSQPGTSYSPDSLEYSRRYYWRIVAKDPHGASTSSDTWHFTTKAEPAETISTPNTPSGPDGGQTDQGLTYDTGGSISNLGHSVQYRFAWGDGDSSTWSYSSSASHSWLNAGTYNVKAQVRCATHTDKLSSWSSPKPIVIRPGTHTVSTPVRPSGPDSGYVGETLTYTTGGTTCNLGHSVQYRFVWGLADYSAWSYSTNADHQFSGSGTFYVEAQARCAVDTSIKSEWSNVKPVIISDSGITNCLVVPSYLDFGQVIIGTHKESTFTLKNAGTTIISGYLSESCADYELVSGPGPFSLFPGESVIVVVRFAPQQSGHLNCIVETGTSACSSVSCDGEGVKAPDGSLWAMGYNEYGQLGDGTTIDRRTPVMIEEQDVLDVASGTYHSLFHKAGLPAKVWGMGANGFGQIGDGTTTDRHQPVVSTGLPLAEMDCGEGHSVLARKHGGLFTVGHNHYGQLGDSSYSDHHSWVKIDDRLITAVAAGENHSLFVLGYFNNKSLWAMGANYHGQLGDGTTADRNYPVMIVGDSVTKAAAGVGHSLFLKTDGSLWGMGLNKSGQLGDGTSEHRKSPIKIVEDGVISVAAGALHTVFIKSDGSLWAMGDNGFGQLGDGTTTDRHYPVKIVSNSVVAVAAGGYHTLYLKSDGSLWSTGNNSYGQLGDGTTTDRHTPVQIRSGGVKDVAAGEYHSLYIMGTLK